MQTLPFTNMSELLVETLDYFAAANNGNELLEALEYIALNETQEWEALANTL